MRKGWLNGRKEKKGSQGACAASKCEPESGSALYLRKMIGGRQYVLTDNDLNELKKKIVRKESEIQNGIYSNVTKVTLNEWFYKWMDVYKGNLKITTRNNYFTGWKNYVENSKLGNMQISKIKRMHLVELYKELSEKKELATSTVHNVHIMIYGCLSDAMDDGMITENPATNAFKHTFPQS